MGMCYLPSIIRGADWSRTITWDDADGNPINLTGYSAACRFFRGSTWVFELGTAVDVGGITLGGSAGTVALNITAAETSAAFEAGATYRFDVVLISPSNVKSVLIQGRVAVVDSVSLSA
jgi:hypothetical protein